MWGRFTWTEPWRSAGVRLPPNMLPACLGVSGQAAVPLVPPCNMAAWPRQTQHAHSHTHTLIPESLFFYAGRRTQDTCLPHKTNVCNICLHVNNYPRERKWTYTKGPIHLRCLNPKPCASPTKWPINPTSTTGSRHHYTRDSSLQLTTTTET